MVATCSRNGEPGSGRTTKQPMSSISVPNAGPLAGRASARPGCGGTIWPMIPSGPISSSMVRSALLNVRKRGLASAERTGAAAAAASSVAESNVSAASSASILRQV